MGPSKGDEMILSYNDAVLRRSDLDILRGLHYINDRIIEFYFSHLSSSLSSDSILLVPPSISFWITNCPDAESVKDVVEPLKLRDRELVIFPVNDNDDVTQAEGGMHWSLLAYDRVKNAFMHHDSSRGINGWHAKKLYSAVKGFLTPVGSELTARFSNCFTPQQANGYDCGLYVMAITRVICSWYDGGSKDEGDRWVSALKEEVSASVVANMRGEILKLILDLMEQK